MNFSIRSLTFILLLVFFMPINELYAQTNSLTYDEWKKENLLSELFSEVETKINVSKNENIILPIQLHSRFILDDLYDIDIKNTSFYSRFQHHLLSKQDTLFITVSKDTLIFFATDHVQIIYPEDDKNYISYGYDKKINDSLHQYFTYFEGPLPHKWNLRNYPFDNQKLKYVIETRIDTSLVRMTPMDINTQDILSGDFKYLKDGYELGLVSVEHDFFQSSFDNIKNYPSGERLKVFERFVYNVELTRKGSFLYFKLFFGAFLSFLISYLVFFINPTKFDTRITLSLGGIFGGVGNKYFVENTMPYVQVLTKADLINNLVILLIIVNIFIVIAQSTEKIKLRWIEKNTNAAILSLLLMFLLNLTIVYFP